MPRKFIRLVEFNTSADIREIQDLYRQWVESVQEEVNVSPIITEDVETPGWIMVLENYDSYDDASMVVKLDVTNYFYKKLEESCTDGPFYRNLEVSDR